MANERSFPSKNLRLLIRVVTYEIKVKTDVKMREVIGHDSTQFNLNNLRLYDKCVFGLSICEIHFGSNILSILTYFLM